ncbi:MAG TPA: hypothetical protein VK050_08665 [Flavobacteriaceae bacterium]|nr:hypothetical protein [Flavobacteriaceae bacterium]
MAKEIKNTILVLAIVLMDVAARIFKYNPELDKIFLTSDGQGFKEYEKAVAHSAYLSDKKVTTIERSQLKQGSKSGNGAKDSDDETESITPGSSDEEDEASQRDLLIAEYTKLYGKAPSHNIKTETLEARVAEAKEEANQKESEELPEDVAKEEVSQKEGEELLEDTNKQE